MKTATCSIRAASWTDLYDQTGNLYNEDGSLLYQGGFLQGLYSGDGVLNITQGTAAHRHL